MYGIKYPIEINNNQVRILTLEESIAQNMTAILSTPKGSIAFNGGFGSNLHKLFFEPIDEVLKGLLHTYVREALKQEDRIQIIKISTHVQQQNGSVSVQVYYKVIKNGNNRTLFYDFQRQNN